MEAVLGLLNLAKQQWPFHMQLATYQHLPFTSISGYDESGHRNGAATSTNQTAVTAPCLCMVARRADFSSPKDFSQLLSSRMSLCDGETMAISLKPVWRQVNDHPV